MKCLWVSVVAASVIAGASLPAIPGIVASQEAATTPAPNHYLVLLRTGPNFTPGGSPQAQPGFQEHAQYMAKLAREGKVVLGGPFFQDRATMAPRGALLIVAAETEAEARQLAEDDPFAASGIVQVEAIHPFVIGAAAPRPCPGEKKE
ncbi:MAG: hypothetical protein HY653_04780 [Acidobacteria bacterium]|nr:hypothetical protein [Acidobacteriota bacterium]